MRWQQGRRSTNIQNRQGLGGKAAVAGGGGLFFALALVVFVLGGNPMPLIGEGLQRTVESRMLEGQTPLSEEENTELTDFVSVVLGSTEDVWGTIFSAAGERYPQPDLILFSGMVDSSCGRATAASGPFYCPFDKNVYIDLSFYHELKASLNAPGDFAQAYVIAHEVGHHVQNLTGVLDQVEQARARLSQKESNALQVRVELQADCYSGIWARAVQDRYDMIEEGDIDEALNAASQIGDDRLQKQAQGYVVPDSFTHGTSQQRKTWFKRGFEQGTLAACDTFSVSSL